MILIRLFFVLKKRNREGKIIETIVPVKNFNGSDVLIIDDICDGGRTFIEIAKICKNRNSGNVYLVVSHAIFSNGLGELSKWFTKIYSTNSISEMDSDFVKQWNIFDFAI